MKYILPIKSKIFLTHENGDVVSFTLFDENILLDDLNYLKENIIPEIFINFYELKLKFINKQQIVKYLLTFQLADVIQNIEFSPTEKIEDAITHINNFIEECINENNIESFSLNNVSIIVSLKKYIQ